MLVLAIDTAAEFGSLAVADENGTREEVLLHAPDGFSGILFAQLGGLLARQSLHLRDIDLFAAASGPGSFTGVRVGLAAIKGLAEVMERPAAGVSNLEAVASFGTGGMPRAPLIDARRGEVYAGVFGVDGSIVISESVLPFPKFLALAGDRKFEWVSSDFDPFRPALAGTPFEQYPVSRAPRALAAAVARIAMTRTPQGAAALEANYVRRSDAELLWKN